MAYPYADEIWDTTSSHAYWNATTHASDTVFHTAADTAWGFSRVSLIFSRTTPAGSRIDTVMIDFSIALLVGGGLISPLSSTDKANAEGDLDTWWGSVKAYVDAGYTLTEYAWRDLKDFGTKFSPINRITTRSVVGTGTGVRLPDQVAENVTFRTASRKHWGRVYVPGIASGALASYGLWNGTFTGNLVTYTDTLGSNLAGHAGSLLLGVGSLRYYGFLTCKQMETDNVPDIQRRRRANQASDYHFKP